MSEPETIGRYRVLRRIGRGGMAEVFACRLGGIGGFDKEVVIKRILPELVDEHQFVEMFLDEARLVAHLNHPNVIHIYEIDVEDGVPFIAMEHVHGVSLQQLGRRAWKTGVGIDPIVGAKIMSQVALGLDHAHNATAPDGTALNIIHRDVTPHNVLISFEGNVKLVDFGVARAARKIANTEAGTIKGKIAYLAPEYASKGRLDARADVFMAGVTLYQATTGRLPFRGDSDLMVLKAIFEGKYEPPTSVRDDYPPELERVVMSALKKDPAERFPSARHLHDALEEVCASAKPQVSSASLAAVVKQIFPAREDAERAAAAALAPTGSNDLSGSAGRGYSYNGSTTPSGAAVTIATGSAVPRRRAVWIAAALGLPILVGLGVAGGVRLSWLTADARTTAPAAESDDADARAAALVTEAARLQKDGDISAARSMLRRIDQSAIADAKVVARVVRLEQEIDAALALELGRRALAEGNLEEASRRVHGLLERDPLNDDALAMLAQLKAKTAAGAEVESSGPRRDKRRRGGTKRSKRPKVGVVSLRSTPAALIYIDGSPEGRSPLEGLKLPSGRHVIEARAGGYRPLTRTVTVDPKRSVSLALELRPAAPEKPAEPAKKPGPAAKRESVAKPEPARELEPATAASSAAAGAKQPRAPEKTAATPARAPASSGASEAPPKKPRLPPTFDVASKKELVRAFGVIEQELIERGALPETVARNVTARLAQRLLRTMSPGTAVEIYPRAMYYHVIAAHRRRLGHAAIAASLETAHRTGELRAYNP